MYVGCGSAVMSVDMTVKLYQYKLGCIPKMTINPDFCGDITVF